jgi:hypothetical protein
MRLKTILLKWQRQVSRILPPIGGSIPHVTKIPTK